MNNLQNKEKEVLDENNQFEDIHYQSDINSKINTDEGVKKNINIPQTVTMITVLIVGIILINGNNSSASINSKTQTTAQPTQASLIDAGHILPIDVENKMLTELVGYGVIDTQKISQFNELNLLWAYGLANSNPILDSGPINDPRNGGPTNMASVGGFTATNGNVMSHYSKHKLTVLTESQQQLVEKMSKGIYRPCCNNSTYFPDCNHGMAMLGLLEYLASQNKTEEEIWNVAMTANVTWFPDTYQTIGQYFKQNRIDIKTMSPQTILGADYSSYSGFSRITSQVSSPKSQSGTSCSLGQDQAPVKTKQVSCGL